MRLEPITSMLEISRAIKEMSEIELPPGLHGRIMRRLLFLKFRTPFIAVISLLIMNLAVSMVRVWELWESSEGTFVLSFSWQDFELSLGGLRDFFSALYDVTPVMWIGVVVLNLLLVAYVAHFPVALRKIRGADVEA